MIPQPQRGLPNARAAALVLVAACGGGSIPLALDDDAASSPDAASGDATIAQDASADVDASDPPSDANTLDVSDAADEFAVCTATVDAAASGAVLTGCNGNVTCFHPKGGELCSFGKAGCDPTDFWSECGYPQSTPALCMTNTQQSAGHCCLYAATVTPGACGTISISDGGFAGCENYCSGFQMCLSDADCAGQGSGHCVPKFFVGFPTLVEAGAFGVCE